MTNDPWLIMFDLDGTLVDSQAEIVGAMRAAYAAMQMDAPADDAIRRIIGLSLEVAIARLSPELDADTVAALRDQYTSHFLSARARGQERAALFDGARDHVEGLSALDHVVLGVATGKAMRGLDYVIRAHDLNGLFLTKQTADLHPSKPHPSMLHAAQLETGIPAARTVMIGDTTYDMEMGRAAGCTTIGVGWGYHPVTALKDAGCHTVADDFGALGEALQAIWSR